jgi:hypothetical protein
MAVREACGGLENGVAHVKILEVCPLMFINADMHRWRQHVC